MDEREALLAAIRDDPNDDTVRLAYCDWLQERGTDPRLEKFIRLQLELSKIPEGTPHEENDKLYLLHDARDLLEELRDTDLYPDYVGTAPWFKVRDSMGMCHVEYEQQGTAAGYINPMLIFHRGFLRRTITSAQELLGGNTCRWCGGRAKTNSGRRYGRRSRRCRECGGTGCHPGLLPYLRTQPVEEIVVFGPGDGHLLHRHIQIDPPGPDYLWQAYAYLLSDETNYVWMTGGRDTKDDLLTAVADYLKTI